MTGRKLRMGMIGGGIDAFIGAVHRNAALLDGEIELVCGAFSSSAERSKRSGESLFLPPEKIYPDYQTMINAEKALPENERMDFVSIVTPNHLHFQPAALAMQHGFDVVLDKPMTLTLGEAKALQGITAETGRLFCLTHTYTGYPMIKQARRMVAAGQLGKIRKVYVAYPQGWLSQNIETKQAEWRTDPSRSGVAGCMGDIGTHAFNMAEYVSGLRVSKICADLNVVVEDRTLDDDGEVLLRFENGASGLLYASQIATGEENNIRISIYGDLGGLEWMQEDQNSLRFKRFNEPTQIYRTGSPYLDSFASHNTRTPPGHPEGYLEAFANLYRNFALTLRARKNGTEPKKEWLDFPGIEDGLRGMAFIENVVAASAGSEKWFDFKL